LASARGRSGGRPAGLSKEAHKTAIAAKQLYESKTLTVPELCDRMGISKTTLYRYLKAV
jgi:AcrR family transcriptional regulator